MAETTPMVDPQIWARYNQLLISVLPLAGLRDLLSKLSTGWRDLAAVDAAFVSTSIRSTPQIVGYFSRRGHRTCLVELDVAHSGVWSGEDVSRGLHQRLETEFSINEQIARIPFYDDETPIGGAILFSNTDVSLAEMPLGELADLSVRLLLESRRHGSLPTDEAPTHDQHVDTDLEDAKLEALAEFAAGAGHEINNPVATIAGRVALLLKQECDPDRRQALTTIGGQAYRIRDMIGDVMLFARPPQPDPKALELVEVVNSVLEKLRQAEQSQRCSFRFEPIGLVPIWADRTQLCVAISELIRNSVDAASDGGTITIQVQKLMKDSKPFALLSITDDGPGLSEIDRQHLFDPFYSGRQAGRGLGFGLPKCWRIITNHGGRIDVDSLPKGETTFKVIWPADVQKGPLTRQSTEFIPNDMIST